MYHCGTPPVLAHIASGMYGAIVVDPVGGWQPKADRAYVLVGSEWYLNGDGKDKPAGLDMDKARHMQPDFVTWNGYAGQYKANPLPAKVGENIRFFVVAAGPCFDTDFHIVGTLLDRAWTDGNPKHVLTGAQTVSVPAGGGAIFDTHFDEDGLYPFVSHSFASGRHGPGRPGQRRQREGDDEPLAAVRSRARRLRRRARRRPSPISAPACPSCRSRARAG